MLHKYTIYPSILVCIHLSRNIYVYLYIYATLNNNKERHSGVIAIPYIHYYYYIRLYKDEYKKEKEWLGGNEI